MKFLTFILSIYILALNFSPCEDINLVNDDVKSEIVQQADDGDIALDLCTPFCQCHCCHIHATHFKIVELTINSTKISTDIFYYFNGLEKDFNNSILQPPQV